MNIKIISKDGTTLKTANKYCAEDINITFDPTLLDITTEEKTFTPTSSVQTYTPTSGTYISKVTVNAVPTETKTATPSTSTQTITPTSGKFLSKVTVNAISTETKTVTPTASSQSVTPTSGKYLTKVTVNAIPSSYIIPSGTLTITENGTHDVSTYANVEVNVESSGGGSSGETETCTIILSSSVTTPFEMYCVKTLTSSGESVDMVWYPTSNFIEISNVVCGSLITVVVSGVFSIASARVSFYEPVPYPDESPGVVVGKYMQTFVLQAPARNIDNVPSEFNFYDSD